MTTEFSEKENRINGITYLFLMLGIWGWAIDALIYFVAKNKHTKLHALQSCFLALIITLITLPLAFAFREALLEEPTQSIISISFAIVYIAFAFSVFLRKDIRIPFIVKIARRRQNMQLRKTSPQEPRKSRG
ncbi:MAG: hypothetical protein MUP55_02245 [Candidatus Aenigmarchaeota archaeon]|nr:hypothetical protein [Candidatus Aenigmarchaeota archaeon]